MKETIKPLGDNVLVRIAKKETKTKSGIVLPDTVNEDRPQEGKVIAVGDGKHVKVKKNQRVIFAKYSGSEIKIADEEYLIIKSEDILAVIE
jgi:chaperonin GroES